MSKALLMILPLLEGTLFDSDPSFADSNHEITYQIGKEKTERASFLGFIDSESPSEVYVVKNRVGYGGSQPLSVLEHHIMKTYEKQPEEEKTYGVYY